MKNYYTKHDHQKCERDCNKHKDSHCHDDEDSCHKKEKKFNYLEACSAYIKKLRTHKIKTDKLEACEADINDLVVDNLVVEQNAKIDGDLQVGGTIYIKDDCTWSPFPGVPVNVDVECQIVDANYVGVENTEFNIRIRAVKTGNEVTLYFPAINGQVGQPSIADVFGGTTPQVGYVRSISGFLPHHLRPNSLIYESVVAPVGDGSISDFAGGLIANSQHNNLFYGSIQATSFASAYITIPYFYGYNTPAGYTFTATSSVVGFATAISGTQSIPAGTLFTLTVSPDPTAAGFPSSGSIFVQNGPALVTVSYQALGPDSFLQCTSPIAFTAIDTAPVTGVQLYLGSAVSSVIPSNSWVQESVVQAVEPFGPNTYNINLQGPIGTAVIPVEFFSNPILTVTTVTSGSPPLIGAELLGPATTVNGAQGPLGPSSFTLNVTSDPVAAGFTASGTIYISLISGVIAVAYAAISGNSFTGCTSASAFSTVGGEAVSLIAPGTTITGYAAVNPDGTGAYFLSSTLSASVGSITDPISTYANQTNVLNVTAIVAGQPLRPGMVFYAPGVAPGSTIIAYGSGTGGVGTYIVNIAQTFPNTLLQVNFEPYGLSLTPIQVSGYKIQIGPWGDILIGACGTPCSAIPTGNFCTKPCSIKYLSTPRTSLQNTLLNPGLINITQWPPINSEYGPPGSGIRDIEVNEAYNGNNYWVWQDNSNQVDQSYPLSNVMYVQGTVSSAGQIVLGTPFYISNSNALTNPTSAQYQQYIAQLPNYVTTGLGMPYYIFCCAVVANRSNPNNVVVSWGQGNVPTFPCAAVSMDAGATFPISGPINIQPSGGLGGGDNRGVSCDLYGNIWYSTTNDYAYGGLNGTDNPILLVSPDGGITYYIAYTTPPGINNNDSYDTPQTCFGYDGANANVNTTINLAQSITIPPVVTGVAYVQVQFTLNVASTVGFPSTGIFTVLNTSGKLMTITYSGTTATSFTGCIATDTYTSFSVANGATVQCLGNYGIWYVIDYFPFYGQNQFIDLIPFVAFIPITGKMSNATTSKFVGTIAGNKLTVTSMISGVQPAIGQTLCGNNLISSIEVGDVATVVGDQTLAAFPTTFSLLCNNVNGFSTAVAGNQTITNPQTVPFVLNVTPGTVTGWPVSASISVLTTTGTQTVTYTNVDQVNGNFIAGCLATSATFSAVDTGLVSLVSGFPTSGTLSVVTTTDSPQTVTYTGLAANGLTFIGCQLVSGGPYTTLDGSQVTLLPTVPVYIDPTTQIISGGPTLYTVNVYQNVPDPTNLNPQPVTIYASVLPVGPLPSSTASTTVIYSSVIQPLSRNNIIVESVAGYPFVGTIQIAGIVGSTVVTYSYNGLQTYTTIIAGDQTLPPVGGILTVSSTAGFLAAGAFIVQTTTGPQTITYTGISSNTFTGATGGTGTTLNLSSVTQSYFTGCFPGLGIGTNPLGLTLSVGDTVVVPSTPSYLQGFCLETETPSVAAAQDGRVWWIEQLSLAVNYKSPVNDVYPDVVNSNWSGPFRVFDVIPNVYAGGSLSDQIASPVFGFFNDDRILIYDDQRQALYASVLLAPVIIGSQDMAIVFIISRDNGQTWSDPIYVSNTSFANRGFQSMALDPITGNLLFSWYDGRATTPTSPTAYQTLQRYGAVIPAAQLDALVNAIPLYDPIYVSGPSTTLGAAGVPPFVTRKAAAESVAKTSNAKVAKVSAKQQKLAKRHNLTRK